jgi:hypothetical protein
MQSKLEAKNHRVANKQKTDKEEKQGNKLGKASLTSEE